MVFYVTLDTYWREINLIVQIDTSVESKWRYKQELKMCIATGSQNKRLKTGHEDFMETHNNTYDGLCLKTELTHLLVSSKSENRN
ncbi:MAG: hypothetical protein M1113_03730 [Candidatus Thermoplasmatota archaeon]|nr:hypothetical protein [Candidatus Thermoplasmatota archaeon]